VEAAALAIEHDVVDVGLEQIGGETSCPIDERLGGDLDRGPADLQRA
jgi:hypothetical protein